MRNLKMLTVLAVLIYIAGCGGGGPDGGQNYHTGSAGLTISFRENSFPSEIFSGREFRIAVDAANIGAYDITDGEIYLTNIIDSDITISGNKVKPLNLHGKSSEYPVGEKVLLSWVAKANSVPSTLSTKIGVAADYAYQTDADISLCIDPDVYGEVPGVKPCVMQEHIGLSSQGGPVAVTSIDIARFFDQDQSSGEVDFTITITNVGGGEIYSGTLSAPEWGYLDTEVLLSGEPVNCDSSKIPIEGNKGEIICHMRYDLKDATTKLMHVTLNYNYWQKIEPRTIKIKKI